MHNKTYIWYQWHKSWVEYDAELKVANAFRFRKKLEEEKKPYSHGYAQAIKSIIVDLN